MPATGTQNANESGVMASSNAAEPATSTASAQSASASGAQLPVPWTKAEDSALIRMMARRFNIDQRGNSLARDFQDPNYSSLPLAGRAQRTTNEIRQRMVTLQREDCTYLIELRNDPKWMRRYGTRDLLWIEDSSTSGAGKSATKAGAGSSEGEGGAKQASSERERAVGASKSGAEKSSDVTAKDQQSKEGNAEAQPTQQSPAKEGEQSSRAVESQENKAGEEQSPAGEEQAKQPDASQTIEPNKEKSRKHKRKREKEPPALIIERIPQRVRLTGTQPDGTAVRYMPNGEVRIEYGPA